MNEADRAILQRAIVSWRLRAEPVGSLHADWDLISDAEALLEGRETFLPEHEVIAFALKEASSCIGS